MPVTDAFRRWGRHRSKRAVVASMMEGHHPLPGTFLQGAEVRAVLRWTEIVDWWATFPMTAADFLDVKTSLSTLSLVLSYRFA